MATGRIELFPIAVVEHHHLRRPVLSTYDVADRLTPLWLEVQKEARASSLTFDANCVRDVHRRVAKAIGGRAGPFLKKHAWKRLVSEVVDIPNDPSHSSSWMFTYLYWTHLTRFRLATAWLYVNGIRTQFGVPPYTLGVEDLGAFMASLSGSGPPLWDGQTFIPERYAK